MASQVEIVNRALIKLGAATISSMDQDNKSARAMTALWDTVRQAELAKRFWNFAITRANLAKLVDVPLNGFGSSYQLPVDFLKVVEIGDYYFPPSMTDYINSNDSVYAIEGTVINTDLGDPLSLRYIKDVKDTGLFNSLFVEVLASKLAYEACYEITQSSQGRNDIGVDYKMAVKEAAMANAISRPPQGIPDDSWMLGRL